MTSAISTSRPHLIEQLQHRLLHQPLPGPEAHLRMAHAVRQADPQFVATQARDAAVLMTLFETEPGQWHMVFIKRTAKHPDDKHAGQIAFPGGKKESSDPDLMYTALRESAEEIALDLSAIDVLGPLTPLYIPVSRFLVHPYLAYSWKIPQPVLQEEEIEEVIQLPVTAFQQQDARAEIRVRLADGIMLNHVPSFSVGGHVIWGATAMILNEFLEILQA